MLVGPKYQMEGYATRVEHQERKGARPMLQQIGELVGPLTGNIEFCVVYILGFLAVTVGVRGLVSPIVEKMYDLRDGKDRLILMRWLPPLFGSLESLLYLLAFIAGHAEFVVFWLTLKVGQKVIVRWQGQSRNEPKGLEIYLVGSMLSLLGSIAVYGLVSGCVSWLGRNVHDAITHPEIAVAFALFAIGGAVYVKGWLATETCVKCRMRSWLKQHPMGREDQLH